MTVTEATVHTERIGDTHISIIKYSEPGFSTYSALLENDATVFYSDIGGYATEFSMDGYESKANALGEARPEAHKLNARMKPYGV